MCAMKCVRIAFVITTFAVLGSAATPPAAPAQRPHARRLWTNDDFPEPVKTAGPVRSMDAAKAAGNASDRPAAAGHEAPAAECESRALATQLATAKKRQGAFEQTMSEMQAKIPNETMDFRREVDERIMRDTLGLSAANLTLMEQLQKRLIAAEEAESNKPACRPETSDR